MRAPGVGRDVLGEHRDRIMLPMSLCVAAVLLPFVIFDWFTGKRVLAAFMVVVILPLALDARALCRGRRPPVAYGWLLLPIAAAIASSMLTHGVHGAMWCYPAILFCYFVLPGWQATAGAIGLLVMTSALVFHVLGAPTMVRFVVTGGMCILFLHIILGVVGALQRKLLEQATTDPLTGALNRREMASTLADAIEYAGRGGHPVTLLVFDLDHFKAINDRHGHQVGDEVLVAVVKLVQERARRIDRLFRTGGEEFALLLPRTAEPDAFGLAEQLRERIAQASWPSGAVVTVSIGVAQLRPSQSRDAWLKAADEALYEAKSAGRNCVRPLRPASRAAPAEPRATSPEARPVDIGGLSR